MTVVYDFAIKFAKLDEAELKQEELTVEKEQSYTVKTHKHIPTNFALVVHYSKDLLTTENEHLVCRVEDFTEIFGEYQKKDLEKFVFR